MNSINLRYLITVFFQLRGLYSVYELSNTMYILITFFSKLLFVIHSKKKIFFLKLKNERSLKKFLSSLRYKYIFFNSFNFRTSAKLSSSYI